MRKNTERVLRAFRAGAVDRKEESIWTDGERIFSYGTVLLERAPAGYVFNATDYSRTTSNKQNSIRQQFGHHIVETHDDVPIGRRSLR